MISKTGNSVLRVSGIAYRVSGFSFGFSPNSKLKTQNSKLAFTLVELMISVVILGFGLCVIIQSYASALSGFNISQNYIAAMRFTKEKQTELELFSYENNGLLPDTKSGEITQGPRKFSWKTEISEIIKPEYLNKDFVTATISLEWQERNIPKRSVLITYLPKRKELEKESGQK